MSSTNKKKNSNEQLWLNLSKLFTIVAILLALGSPLIGMLAIVFYSESGREIPFFELIIAFAMGVGVLLVPSAFLYYLSRKVKDGSGIGRKIAALIGLIIAFLFLSMLF